MTTSATTINLKDLISPAFYELHRDFKADRHVHYFVKGGRGSTKSSWASIEIVLGIMRDKDANAIVFRKFGVDLKDSVFDQLLWAIDILGVTSYWYARLSPLGLYYKPTGQRIVFRGMDDPNKSKSIKLRKGYFKFIWYEEADQFHGMEEIRTTNQSLIRGGEAQKVIYTYNPPISVQSWINAEVLINAENRLVHHSTYLDVPPEWLGSNFIFEAELLKKTNERAYRHDYLGEVTGTGGEIFGNIVLRDITDEEINGFDRISRGIDFGVSDPTAYIVCHLHNSRLYIFREFYAPGAGLSEIEKVIKTENPMNDIVYGDSAEPRTINELKKRGIRIDGAEKGRDSIHYGILFLQDLTEIIIDPNRCPNSAREFSTYEFEHDKNGNFKADYPDKNNHSIDAVRYALCRQMNTKKAKPKPKDEHGFFSHDIQKHGIMGGDLNSLWRK